MRISDNIRRVIADIWPQMLEKVIENWTSRLDYIRASRGSPMPEIIFKIEVIVGSIGTTNQHRTWGRKLRLVGENHDNNSPREDDAPDEECGQKNIGI
ncbi:hypothetical protein TNCV_1409871 [Trichonephila clavipes]|uniref:Uncharacterized protein n=1 Tax=Trichonephila clavipes TaxID=2585209 RepID=A0A8X6RAG0_TRICX|nr:hypothetical protein TNCV_1409871 [Trichonephila clavipes]